MACSTAMPSPPQEYHFAIRLPDGALLSIPGHPNFTAAPAVSFAAPWPPAAARATAQTYGFVLFVRDALGMEAGPFPAAREVAVRAPPCPRPCAGAGGLIPLVGCLVCSGPPSVAALNEVCARGACAPTARGPRGGLTRVHIRKA